MNARCKWVSKGALPVNLKIKRTYGQRAASRNNGRRAHKVPTNQQRKGIGQIFKFAKIDS